jgi:serine protease Do
MLRQSRLFALVGWMIVAGLVPRASGQEPTALAAAAAIEQSMVEAIAAAEKSVVAITRIQKGQPGDDFTPEFRLDPFGRGPSGPQPEVDPAPSEYATGVVVDHQGLILTVGHVLGENSEYFVTTWERKTYRATVKAADPRSDMAVLALEAADVELSPIMLGDAGKLRKGQLVIALGNPYAIARDGQVSASWGIVSNLSRKAAPASADADPAARSTLHHFGTLIQTDAKLNLGTSGGALVNLRGEMVGLTTALAAVTGYEQAAGYAFPVDETFRRVLDTLKQGREVEYGYLGVQPASLSPTEVRGGIRGARVQHVVPGGPGDRFGLEVGDIVTSVDGAPVFDADSLVLAVGRLPVETKVELAVVRNHRPRTVAVVLSKYPVQGRKIVSAPEPPWRGLRVDYTSAVPDSSSGGPAPASFLGEGVIVTDVEQGTPAWQAGLRPYDLVSHVDRAAIRTPQEFRAAVVNKQGAVQLRLVGPDGSTPLRTVEPGS